MRERRQVPRYVSDVSAQIIFPEGTTPLPVKIATLSVKGSCIHGAGTLKTGQKCELKVEWNGKIFKAPAEVIWTDLKGHAGVKFGSLLDEPRAVLRDLCSTLNLQPIQPPQPPPPVKPSSKYE